MTRCAAKTKDGKEQKYIAEPPAMKANRAKIASLFKGVKPYTAAELKRAKP